MNETCGFKNVSVCVNKAFPEILECVAKITNN